MRITPCRACKGQRLKPEALAVTVGDHNIARDYIICRLKNWLEFLDNLELTQSAASDR